MKNSPVANKNSKNTSILSMPKKKSKLMRDKKETKTVQSKMMRDNK